MPIIPDDHCQLVFSHTITGLPDPVAWTLGAYVNGTPASAVDVANRAFQCWVAHLKAQTANEVTLTSVVCYYRQGTDLFVGYSTQAASAGTQGTGSCSPAVSFLVRKNTGLAGRRYRGRAFMPGIRETVVEANGAVTTAMQTQLNTALATFLTAMNDTGVTGFAPQPRLLHSSGTIDPTPITSMTLDPFVGTQRRRQR